MQTAGFPRLYQKERCREHAVVTKKHCNNANSREATEANKKEQDKIHFDYQDI